jgi:pSer/pThr/pTyr-binding forkhead associated (FHA) protein
MIAAELSVIGGKHMGQVIPLNRRKFLIGREHDCQLRPNSERVSRHHCVFSLDDFSVRLKDLGSTNGTFVNGNRIQKETVLSSGDHIVIGNLEFQLSILPGKVADLSNSGELDLRGRADDTQVTSQTILEIPAAIPAAQPAEPLAVKSSEAEPAGQLSPAITQPSASPDAVTVAMSVPQMMPAPLGYGQPMMQPMGFPGGMYGGYPYQHMMPGYGQMYPQMMPGTMGGYPVPQQMMLPSTVSSPAGSAPSGAPDVSLPDPSNTGATDEPVKGSTGSNPKDTQKPTGAAEALLKQYSGRRPGS